MSNIVNYNNVPNVPPLKSSDTLDSYGVITLGEFIQQKAVYKRGTMAEKTIDNPLSLDKQLTLIKAIYERCYSIKIDNEKLIILDLRNGVKQNIERNYKNFGFVIKAVFKDTIYIDTNEAYETINLPKLFEFIKNKDTYSYRESLSIFHNQNRLITYEDKKEIVLEKKLTYGFGIDTISKEAYSEIVSGINDHWQGFIPQILDYMIAGVYATDKKNLWVLILAKSNFGKSKLFKWCEPYGGTIFTDMEDLTRKNNISNLSPSDYEGKLFLTIDEVLYFDRGLYKIEGYLPVRPMHGTIQHVPINARFLLSADGGTFNDEFIETQTKNRVSIIDFRKYDTMELGELGITKKYGKATIALVMTHYLYTEQKKRLDEYEPLNGIERANKADKIVETTFNNNKSTKKDFFEVVEEYIYEIFNNPKDTLDSKAYDIFRDSVVGISTGWVLKRPNSTLKELLLSYDSNLKNELKYKKVPQIVDSIKGLKSFFKKLSGDTSKTRGLYIPFKDNFDKSNEEKETEQGLSRLKNKYKAYTEKELQKVLVETKKALDSGNSNYSEDVLKTELEAIKAIMTGRGLSVQIQPHLL